MILGEQWKEILEVFELTEMTKSLDQTICQRSQTFNKIRRKIVQILDIAAAKHGFQAAIVMCGNIVNEDMSLAFQHTTRGAIGFWGSRCRAHPDTIIGHLKAHVYDDASLRIVEDAFKDEADAEKASELPRNNVETSESVKDVEHAVPTMHSNRPSLPSSDFEPSMDEGDPSSRIKESFIKLVERCSVDTSKLKGNNFPWKTLLSFLASKSLVLQGYPHGILMPGQCRHEGMCTKGINDLTLAEKLATLVCDQGKATYDPASGSEGTSSSSNPPLVQRPVIEKSRKLSGTSPIVIPSSSEPNSPEPQQPRKRKAAALPAPYVCKKRGQEIRPTNAREKGKGAAVRGTRIKKITTAADPVNSSDDEINVRGEDVRKEDAIEQPKRTFYI
ncbi:hypothetical protein J3R83DRAFT_2377 [Lanmaoa asiatica]|nr:hypothetical protein J3R83DRAFT_2377 [Lanmaoa asiatica]